MRLSPKLLGFLNRAFWKDPDAFLALRVQYAGPMQWTVYDGFLTTAVTGGPGVPLSIDLSLYTMATLASFIARQPGYSVPYIPNDPVQAGASALRLVEGTGNIYESNGDHLLGYTNVLHAWIDAMAIELAAAELAIAGIPDEMSTVSADGTWLDYQGSFYAVPRLPDEPDALYGQRIIATVLRPLGNNVAMEAAIQAYTGQAVTISDVTVYTAPEPHYDGTPKYDGTYHHLPGVTPLYNLFDALVGYDLIAGGTPTGFLASVKAIIAGMRDAGMHLRAINLGGSALSDLVAPSSDDADTLVVTTLRRHDGERRYDGTVPYCGDTQDSGTLAASTITVPIIGVVVAPAPVAALPAGSMLGADGAPLLGDDGAPLLSPT